MHKSKGEFTQRGINCLLQKFSTAFTPPLSQTVDIESYSDKLAKYAYFLTAEEGGEVIGFMAYYRNEELRQLYVTHVCVDSAYQHKGIGSKLFESLESLSALGYTTISLEVVKTNIKAYNFYGKHQFVVQEDRGTKFLMLKQLMQ